MQGVIESNGLSDFDPDRVFRNRPFTDEGQGPKTVCLAAFVVLSMSLVGHPIEGSRTGCQRTTQRPNGSSNLDFSVAACAWFHLWGFTLLPPSHDREDSSGRPDPNVSKGYPPSVGLESYEPMGEIALARLAAVGVPIGERGRPLTIQLHDIGLTRDVDLVVVPGARL